MYIVIVGQKINEYGVSEKETTKNLKAKRSKSVNQERKRANERERRGENTKRIKKKFYGTTKNGWVFEVRYY